MADAIGGTVIQRSFVGREATNIIHVASVPVSELSLSDTEMEIKAVMSELLGIPEYAVLDQTFYKLARADLAPRLLLPSFFPAEAEDSVTAIFSSSLLKEQINTSISLRMSADNDRALLSDFISFSSNATMQTPLQSWLLFLLNEIAKLTSVRQEALIIAMQCYGSRLTLSQHTELFLDELYGYEIPIGQSPTVKSDSLLTLLDTAKGFCIAPLAIGGEQAISRLSQGNYISALLTTGTGSAMTLVLIGTVSVGALIVQRVAQARAAKSRG